MPHWLSDSSAKKTDTHTLEEDSSGQQNLNLARESLQDLLQDSRVPAQVRESLAADYAEIEQMLQRLQQGQIHIAVFGRVSVGKSALLNALLGEQKFSTSALHGETKVADKGQWIEYQAGNIYLIDTPGINEIEGEQREQLAREVAARAELVLFVVDGDLTQTEVSALQTLAATHRPILLVLNKMDRYRPAEQAQLLESLQQHTSGLVDPQNIVSAAADPAEQLVIRIDEQGKEQESTRRPAVDVSALKARLWDVLQAEGQTLAALNASLFAGQLSDQVGQKIILARREAGQKIIRSYCIAKGVAVAFNPIPVADLVAALMVDVSMVVHLSQLFGLPLSRKEAGSLIKTIGAQVILLMGTVWAVHFVSSVLKLGSTGLSALVTGGAQGAVAYYSTYIVGQAAEQYLAHGKSWGDCGPKYVVRKILDNLDRDSILQQARQDIKSRLSKA
ncbi:MAG: GTP-binding protein [Gammaproteobacteria bacterium]|nr:GTP-binding protein [Gammaproteobacteria bacterium]